MLVDNCAMQLVKDPKQFDVILTENMFNMLHDKHRLVTSSVGYGKVCHASVLIRGMFRPSGW